MAAVKAAIEKPSSNWQALSKVISPAPASAKRGSKRRQTEHTSRSNDEAAVNASHTVAETSFARGHTQTVVKPRELANSLVNGESLSALRKMMSGELEYSSVQQDSGKYIAIDCEMVGVGIDGKESSLARVSVVNFHGAVQLDVFVRQRERVVDYRTKVSGVRASDMVDAKSFSEVQKLVAELFKDRILIGHAIHHDLKALLLSHPRHHIRDTQQYAAKHKLTRSKRIALRHLVQQELGVTIQDGEHSSVADARATMAVFRLHRKEWEKGQRPSAVPAAAVARIAAKRKRVDLEEEGNSRSTASPPPPKRKANASPTASKPKATALPTSSKQEARSTAPPPPSKRKTQTTSSRPATKRTPDVPGGGRKGVSSGLSTVVKRHGKGHKITGEPRDTKAKANSKWWKELGRVSSKGSMKLKIAE